MLVVGLWGEDRVGDLKREKEVFAAWASSSQLLSSANTNTEQKIGSIKIASLNRNFSGSDSDLDVRKLSPASSFSVSDLGDNYVCVVVVQFISGSVFRA
jgi:hypothetical protein